MRLDNESYKFLVSKLDKASEYRGGLVACCPFHQEKSPSFFIYFDWKHNEQWWFKCHGCELTGSLNTLFRRLRGHHLVTLDSEVKREYAYSERTALFDDTTGFPYYYEYFKSRGISEAVVKAFGFRFDFGGPASIMPVYTNEQYMGYVRRNLDPAMPRYYLSYGMDLSRVLWGLDSVDRRKPVYITEGIIDAACLWSQGRQAISLVVKGSYEYKIELLSQLRKPILVPDNDLSGLKTFKRLAKELPAEIALIPSQFKDVSEMLASGKKLW